MSPGEVMAAQRRGFAPFVRGRFSTGSVTNIPSNKEIVGLVAAVNKDGRARRYIGTADNPTNADTVHQRVDEYAEEFKEEL